MPRHVTQFPMNLPWQHHGERRDGAVAGNGSAAVARLLPPDLNGTTAGKHARVYESTWHTASFSPSWEVNVDRHSDNCLSVVYKMSPRTISRVPKMCVRRQIFMIWAPVDDASGRYSLWCSALNCEINSTSWPSKGTHNEYRISYVCKYHDVWENIAHMKVLIYPVYSNIFPQCSCVIGKIFPFPNITSYIARRGLTFSVLYLNILRPKQTIRDCAEDIFKCIFVTENLHILWFNCHCGLS